MAKNINSKYLEYITPDEDQKEFVSLLNGESDRGLVLVGSSHLDGVLKDILKIYLREPRTTNDTLFSHQGALGSFSNRIEMAYRLGLIDRDFAYVLDRVRKSRNDMAHYIENFSLNASPHVDYVQDAIAVMKGSQFFEAIIEAYRTQTTELRKALETSGLPVEDLIEKAKKERQDFLTIYFAIVTSLKFVRHCLNHGIERSQISIGLMSYMDDTKRLSEMLESK